MLFLIHRVPIAIAFSTAVCDMIAASTSEVVILYLEISITSI